MGDQRSVGIEQLLEHADWLRGLARHLVGQGGEDLAQEVWLAAHRAGPDPARPPRPWLSQVLRNLTQTRRRDDGRRLRREREYQATLPDRALPIDDVYQRLELQRQVAKEVMALDESLRAMVVLRYFEGLDSGRIARLTGAPEGTVRWRLKLALERLRAALDTRHGGQRRAWVAILAPAAASLRPAPITGTITTGTIAMATTTTTKTILAGALALVALLLLSLGLLQGSRRAQRRDFASSQQARAFQGEAGAERGGSQGRRAGATGKPPGSALLAATPPADLWECRTALERIRQEVDAQDRERRSWVPEAAFEAGTPNPRLQAEVAPQIAKLWAGVGAPSGLSHQVECRGWACRLTVIVPGDDSGDVEPWLRSVGPVTEARKIRELALGGSAPGGTTLQFRGSTPIPDERSNRMLEKFVFFFGAPPGTAEAERRATSSVPVPVLAPASVADCRSQLDAARAQQRARLAELAGYQPLARRFAAGKADPALTAKVRAIADQALASQHRAMVECRAAVCRLQFDSPPDGATMKRLLEHDDLAGRARHQQNDKGEVFLTILEDGREVLSRLLEPSRAPGFFAGCPEPPRTGKVLVRIHLPSSGNRNDEGAFERVSVRVVSGNLASTAAGVCLAERIATLVSSEELPGNLGDFMRLDSWSWTPGRAPEVQDP